MLEFINTSEFVQFLFDREDLAEKAGQIIQAILESRSPRLSDISHRMSGNPGANYKAIQRFLRQADPREAVMRLFQEEAPFVIGDPTEIPRPQARKTAYVGTLKDGKTKGFWLLMLATPFRGRAIPCGFVTYSSRTIAEGVTSRNQEHDRAFQSVKQLVGERPLVLDREFSYLSLLEKLVAEEVNFVIRLNLGSHPPVFTNAEGRRVELLIAPEETAVYHQIYYGGQVLVNVIGTWKKGFRKPLWVMTNLAPETGLAIYQARTKIEESFRDLKSLLHLDKVVNKTQNNMEKMVALVLIAYAIGLLVGESIRDHLYGSSEQAPATTSRQQNPAHKGKYWTLYSGLFVLLKQKVTLTHQVLEQLILAVQRAFACLVLGDVLCYV
jgi:hypothetical protein